jgi:large subunit ribosomal protein L15
MTLHDLPEITRRKKRLGRGIGGDGAKSGRGQKGQKSRAGYSRKRGFEGGQTPLYMRLPKMRGAKQKYPAQGLRPAVVTTTQLNIVQDGSIVGIGQLRKQGLVERRCEEIKLVAGGKLEKKLTVRVNAATENAIKQVEQAGGKVEIV